MTAKVISTLLKQPPATCFACLIYNDALLNFFQHFPGKGRDQTPQEKVRDCPGLPFSDQPETKLLTKESDDRI
jgi:hypothetical protein